MNLKQIRLLAGKTQQEVAKATNITQFTYSNYENEKTQPDYETIKKLADYFHTTVDSIIGHQVPYLLDTSTLTNEQRELVEQIKNLPPNLCERVNAYIIGLQAAEEEKQKIINFYKKGE